jgi:GntR family transcriptional regulator, rspAB operon transcriptional repressor
MLVYKVTSGKRYKVDGCMNDAEIETRIRSIESGTFDLDRRQPAAEQVYRLLRDAIITCRIRPNEAISENRICGMFGVSRSPVRTAVTRLAEDGLISIFPQRGTFVAPIKLKDVRENQFARTALEVALVEEASRYWTKDHTTEIQTNLTLQKHHAANGDGWAFYIDNESFHRQIAHAARLGGVWNTVQSVKMLWDRIGHIANRMPGHMDVIIKEHTAIVEALDRNDGDAAITAMKVHLCSMFDAILRLRPLHADYFVEN